MERIGGLDSGIPHLCICYDDMIFLMFLELWGLWVMVNGRGRETDLVGVVVELMSASFVCIE